MDWGQSGFTLVSDKLKNQGELIESCITEDFDIYIGDDIKNIDKTLYIKSLDDVKNVEHSIKFMYWNNNDNEDVCTHKDGQFYKIFSNMDVARSHFKKLGFYFEIESKNTAETGCIIEEHCINKTNFLESYTITNISDLNESDSFTVARSINKEYCVELHYCDGKSTVEYGTKTGAETWENDIEEVDWLNKNMTDNMVLDKLEQLFKEHFGEYEIEDEEYEVCCM